MIDANDPDPVVATELARLRDATAGVAPRAGFVDAVVAAAAAAPAGGAVALHRAWWSVPVAAAVAAAAVVWALGARASTTDDAAARDVEAALTFGGEELAP